MGYEPAALGEAMLEARAGFQRQFEAAHRAIIAALKWQIERVFTQGPSGGLAAIVVRHYVSRAVGLDVARADIEAALAEMEAEGFVVARTTHRSRLWRWRDNHDCLLAHSFDDAYEGETGEQVRRCRWCGAGWVFDPRQKQPPRPANIDWMTSIRGTTELEQRP